MSANFTPNQNEYKNLTPFKNWLLLQINTWGQNNFPFVESDFDELTNYGMMQKLMGAVNDVISNENEVEQDMTNLFNAFTELQTYVNDYFDNLDVQDEINAKLDEMAADGTLSNLISQYLQPYIDTQNTKIDEIETKVDAVASGSPLVASSTAEMTDTTRVYVNTTDGKWYYYDGDSWEIGGTYQSTAIGENEIELQNLSTKLQDSVNGSFPIINRTDGYYIASWGSLAESTNYCYTDGIFLNKGDRLVFNASGAANNVVILSTKLNPTSYTAIITASDNNVHEFSYVATNSGLYYISSNKNNLSNIAIYRKNYSTNEMPRYFDEFKNYDSSIIYNETNTSNLIVGYVKYNTGDLIATEGYYCTDFIEVHDETNIEMYSGGNNLSAYSTDTGLCFYDENKQFISGVKIPVEPKIDMMIPKYTKYIRFTISYLMRTNGYQLCYKSLKNQIENIYDKINKTSNYVQIFHKIGVIGDSLSSGEIAYNDGEDIQYIDKYDYSWLSNIARFNGIEKQHFSAGGMTTKSWLTSSYKTQFLNNANKCNAYIIALGTNDRYQSYSLGNLSDVAGTDSFVGYYKEIIDLIKTTYPNSAIFLLSLYNPAGNTYSDMIEDIAGLYENVYFLDYVNSTNIYTTTPNYSSNGHFNTQGYVYVSEIINKLINDKIKDNMTDFQYFAINN